MTAARRLIVLLVCLAAPAAASAQQPPDTIAEIRVHGNHTTSADDVRRIAGLMVGEPALDARLQEAEGLLRASGRFAAIDLRRRLRSIADPSQVLVVIVVTEHPGVTPDGRRPGVGGRIRRAAMWLPVLGYEDGYGFTYGARVTFVDALGAGSRVSVPLTWGGERRAGIEAERRLGSRRTSVRGQASVHRKVNPHFDRADTRHEVSGGIEHAWTRWLRSGADVGVARVVFGDTRARHSRAGLYAAIDTRLDPSFPRNAVHARVGWERLAFDQRPSAVGRWNADLRGYVGAGGARVIALRGAIARADGPLPPAEQALLGGGGSLRGSRAGHRAGDSLAAVSAELRWPLTSPLRRGRFGVKGFVDAGTVWPAGQRLRDQPFERAIGAGLYAGVAMLQVSFDIAWAENGRARGHLGLGVTF